MIRKIVKDLIKKRIIPYRWREVPIQLPRADVGELQKLKDKFKGKRCFIIGNGPSLNKIDLDLLKDEYTFGVNSIFLKTEQTGFKPNFYMVEDSHVMSDNVDDINKYDVEYKFFPTAYKKYIANKKNTYFFNMNIGFYYPLSPNYQKPRFSTDASDQMYCGQSVTMMNLQLAYHLGFTEVYLIGMDFSYNIPDSAIVDGGTITSTEDDENHFDSRYFGAGKKWHDPQLDNVLKNYKMAKFMYELEDRKIFNSTVGGKLELFERIEFNSLF